MFFILAGGGVLAGSRFGDEVVAAAIMFLLALCFSAITPGPGRTSGPSSRLAFLPP